MPKMSLVKQAAQQATGSLLPAELQPPPVDDVVESIPQVTHAYVQFAHPLSPSWDKLRAELPSLKTADPVLVLPAAPPLILSPFRFLLHQSKQFWAHLDNRNTVTKYLATEPDNPREWAEVFECVLLVFTPDGLVPATCRFAKARSAAGRIATRALREASRPEWAAKGEAYKLSLGCPDPFGRFFATVSQSVRKGPKGEYHTATSVINATGPDEFKALGDLARDANRVQLLRECITRHNEQMADHKSKA